MMTEADALETAQLDAKRLHKKIQDGAMPDDFGRAVLARIVRRIDGFERPNASQSARAAAQQRLTAPTFSEHLASRAVAVVLAAMHRLPPEDSRALALWLIGTLPQVPGFLPHIIGALSESSGQLAIERSQRQLEAVLRKMQAADEDLFQKQITTLSGPRQRIIQGLLLDAQWAFQERDGITARLRVMRARRVAMRWLKGMARQRRMLGQT